MKPAYQNLLFPTLVRDVLEMVHPFLFEIIWMFFIDTGGVILEGTSTSKKIPVLPAKYPTSTSDALSP